MFREMQVSGLTLDAASNAPIVLLREVEGTRVLPIWIGVIEASAIAFELEGVAMARPMTHDLMQSAITTLGAAITGVSIVDLRDNTYFARIDLEQAGRALSLDARPSDAIALALRAKARILCSEDVLSKAQAPAASSTVSDSTSHEGPTSESGPADDMGPRPIIDSGSRSWLEVLEALAPEDFGKYKM